MNAVIKKNPAKAGFFVVEFGWASVALNKSKFWRELGAVGRLCDRALAQGACAFRKDAKAPSMAAQRGPSLARDALLQAQAPIALDL
jgi:hypothetical protein